jgi:hypothetical protein
VHDTIAIACRYKDVLGEAASQISRIYDASHTALVVNLGPAWLSGEAYELFNSNVIEIPFKDWESPPGLGICPLGVIFTVCSSIASWLALNEGNVVVSAGAAPMHAQHQALLYASPGCTLLGWGSARWVSLYSLRVHCVLAGTH